MPTPLFPTKILRNGVKITNEQPKGIKHQLIHIYSGVDEPNYINQNQSFKKLYFALSLFHSIISERKKFGPLGWNNSYDWIYGDFNTSILQLEANLDHHATPFKQLIYFIGQINYGGRVTD